MWSCGRYSSLVCVVSGHLCVLGLWVVLFPEAALFVSRRLFMSVCPPGTSARFGNVPGAGAFGGFDSPAGLWLRLLLLLARDVQSVVSSLRSSVVLRAVPPPLVGVRCFRCLWVWGVLVALIKLVGFLVGLRLWAAPSGCAFGLRLRAAPSGCAFGLRLRARPKPRLDSEPMGDARGRSRIPHKTPTADRGRSYGKKWPCGVLEGFLPAPFAAIGLRFLRRDDRQNMMFDPDDEW